MRLDARALTWPDRWQPDAIEALLPYIGTDARVRILLDDPKVAVFGTVLEEGDPSTSPAV